MKCCNITTTWSCPGGEYGKEVVELDNCGYNGYRERAIERQRQATQVNVIRPPVQNAENKYSKDKNFELNSSDKYSSMNENNKGKKEK